HDDGRGDDRQSSLLAQLAADLRTDRFDAPDLEALGTVFLREIGPELIVQSAELNGRLFQPDEELVGAFLPEVLNHDLAFAQFPERPADLRDRGFLREAELNDGAAGEIDAQGGAA